MTEDDVNAQSARPTDDLRPHEVRTALLDLLTEVGTVTATEAATRLGYSSGLCSFHLRQLARHSYVEEAPHSGGRARPWRLSQATPDPQFGDLARGLEDETWQRWLSQRADAPPEWRHDQAFSAVAYLTPDELARVATTLRRALAPYADREQRPLARPADARPVALISRLFPLLPHQADDPDRD